MSSETIEDRLHLLEKDLLRETSSYRGLVDSYESEGKVQRACQMSMMAAFSQRMAERIKEIIG